MASLRWGFFYARHGLHFPDMGGKTMPGYSARDVRIQMIGDEVTLDDARLEFFREAESEGADEVRDVKLVKSTWLRNADGVWEHFYDFTARLSFPPTPEQEAQRRVLFGEVA